MADVLVAAEGARQDLRRRRADRARSSDVSFDLEAAEFAAVVGQSGSGKSTLLNLIGLLDTPTTGRVLLNGRDSAAATRKQRAALRNDLIGFVFQFHYLLPEFSVLENVLMPGSIAGAGAGGPRARAPRRFWRCSASTGSREERQRPLRRSEAACGHRARADEPPALVLADEPTGNLDTENTKAVYELFRTSTTSWHRVPDRHARSRRGAADRPHPRGQRRRACCRTCATSTRGRSLPDSRARV